MVQAAQNRRRADSALAVVLTTGQRLGRRLAQALVGPGQVEVRHVLAERAGEVALAEDEQVVEALAAHAVLFTLFVTRRGLPSP